jgi:hypothetical protein
MASLEYERMEKMVLKHLDEKQGDALSAVKTSLDTAVEMIDSKLKNVKIPTTELEEKLSAKLINVRNPALNSIIYMYYIIFKART